jgi:hypothetical protein
MSATAVTLPSPESGNTLEQQVKSVADQISQMAMAMVESKSNLEVAKGN